MIYFASSLMKTVSNILTDDILLTEKAIIG